MKTAKNEISLIYDSNDPQDREALGYAKSLKHYQVKEYDLRKHTFTATQIEEIAEILNLNPRDLINERSTKYIDEYAKVKLDTKGVLKALTVHPEMMKTPIAILHDGAKIMNSSYEFIKEDMSPVKADLK